jgi:hypothetical protein
MLSLTSYIVFSSNPLPFGRGYFFVQIYPLKSSVYLQWEARGVDFPGKKQRKVTPPNKISKA